MYKNVNVCRKKGNTDNNSRCLKKFVNEHDIVFLIKTYSEILTTQHEIILKTKAKIYVPHIGFEPTTLAMP